MSLATDLANLKIRRAAICAKLANLTDTAAGGKPNTSGGGGAHVDHVGYKDGLYRELESIDALIKSTQEAIQAEDLIANGPWEIES